jgi:hypothetical protein
VTIPARLLTTTCDIYRPFGSGVLVASAVACRLAPTLARGRGSTAGLNYLIWSHQLDVDDTTDIRDGCTRMTGQNAFQYSDGDEVRIPDSSSSIYVVVWVEMLNRGTALQFKRAYLLRHAPAWPGP